MMVLLQVEFFIYTKFNNNTSRVILSFPPAMKNNLDLSAISLYAIIKSRTCTDWKLNSDMWF
jgi:hypothetical protein